MTVSPDSTIVEMLEEFEETHTSDLDLLATYGDKLLKASREIRQSWSGSFVGWHGRMYFGDFEKPSIHEMFSGEWGGLRGIPEGWKEKDTDQVTAKIDAIIGKGFSVNAFDEKTKAIRIAVENFREDVDLYLSLLGVPSAGKARDYLTQIESLGLGDKRSEFISQNLPTGLMSRDSEALRQGMVLPAWLYFEALGYEATKIAEWFREYRKRINRLLQLLEIAQPTAPDVGAGKLSVYALHPVVLAKCSSLYESGAFAEAVEKSFKTVRDRLRKLTGFETGSEAFGKTKLHITGAAAENVDHDFNQAAKFLMMAIDNFRNEKSHTSDAKIDDPARAYQYLVLSSLALHLLDQAEMRT